ncbi:MAG: hypothetical protein HY710_15320 [Candidatus Latescibacteria bacterium]|nr:hypothetical protein [Candidatus Latescibacterota bacterium]
MRSVVKAALIALVVLGTATASLACEKRHNHASHRRARVVHVPRPDADRHDDWSDSALLALGLFGLGWLLLSRRPRSGKPRQPMV